MAVTLVFGAPAAATIGVVQSMSKNESAEIAEARDNDGKVIEQKAYSKGTEIQVEALLDTSATPPAAGESVTIDSVAYLVTSCNVVSSNTEFKKVSITAVKKDSATLTALTSEPAG